MSDFSTPEGRLYIAGELRDAQSGATYPNVNPATEEEIGRVADAGTADMEAAIADHPGETVVVACHGGVINTYLADLLGLSMDMFYRPVHASVHRVRFKGTIRVIDSLNEQTFLRDQGLLSL